MSVILIVAIFALIISLGFYLFLRFMRTVQPDEFEIEEDLEVLRASVASFRGGLMPWTDNLSSNQVDQILTKSNARSGNGVFLSDLGDPIFAYAYNHYIGPGQNALLYILSHEHEYVYRITNKGTEVFIDGEKKGLIRENGIFYDVRNDEVARVKRLGAQGIQKIYIGEEEIAKIALPDSLQTSALKVSRTDLNPLEQETVRLMAVYELVNQVDAQEE